jgi:nitrogen PTS system EIIA component
MKLSQLLNKNSIIVNLKATEKKTIIEELAGAVSKATKARTEDIAQVLWEREQIGSTGIGGGIAIPHGKLGVIEEITVGFGLSKEGVGYDSLDNKPVHIFFLLITPENSTGGHLKVLAQISKLLKMEHFKQDLKSAESAEHIYNVIMEVDEEF